MDNKQTDEWIAQQREICDVRIAKMLGKFEHNAYDYNIDGRVLGVNISEFKGYMLLAGLCSEVLPAALDALEASMQREADQEKRHMRWNELMSTALVTAEKRAKEKDNIIVRLTAERDALFAYLDTEERLAFKKHQTEKTVSTYDKWVQTVHLFVGVANVVPRDPCAENAPEGRS